MSMLDDVQEVLISEEQLQRRVAELGANIAADYAGKTPVLICVLKGASMFLVDLMRAGPDPAGSRLHGHLQLWRQHQEQRRGAHPQGPGHGDREPATCWSWKTSSTPA